MELLIENLTKAMDEVQILDHINLKINSGEAVALVGANGAGKTTLINCVLSIYTQYSGNIYLNGFNVKEKECESERKKIAFVLDTTGLFSTLNAWDNLEFYDRIYHPESSAKERKERLSSVFSEISLSGKEKMPVTKYSKGMKQRLAIGRTLVTHPELIVLDEPYLGLDFEGKYFLTNQLLKLKKRSCTILLSSHDLTEIEKVCDKAIFIKGGVLKEEKELSKCGRSETEKSELEQMYARVLM